MDFETSENRPKRGILILGDGNFSYSLSYARMHAVDRNKKSSSELGPSFQQRHRSCSTDSANITVYATSYDSEETIKQDQIAWENVQALKEIKYVTVLHGVDATNLDKQFDLRTKFSKVIFNFPHVGSKSNIKACRSLLERFFQCIADFVTEEGKVCVALCKGQGGTPIDTQRKGYGNTWQVATQAASAGLILKKIKPFKIQKVPAYEPAGYRGRLGQGFIRDGSLYHIFIKKKRVKSTTPNDARKFANKESFITAADNFYRSDLNLYDPFRICWHPFVAACDTLFNCLYAVFKIHSRVTDRIVLGCSGEWSPLLSFSISNDKDESSLFLSETFIDSTVEISPYSYPVYKEVVLTASSKKFRSLDEFVNEIKQRMTHQFDNCSFKTCQVNTTKQRYLENAVFLGNSSVNNPAAFDASTTPNFLADIQMKSWLKLKPEVTVTREEKMDFNATSKGSNAVQYEKIDFDDYDLGKQELAYFDIKKKQLSYKQFFNDSSDVYGISVNDVLIAECCTINKFSSSEPMTEPCGKAASFIAVIRLDHLSMCLLGIDDVRLLWSRDEAHLQSLTDCLVNKVPRNELPMPPVSYPLCYRHDLCFWVNDIISHDLLLVAIRHCCHDTVHSVRLLRILRHEETKLLSFCYRMIYSRCDGPLSHKETVELQNNLRKVLIDLKFDLR